MEIGDHALIKKIQAGDTIAFEVLVQKHYQQIYEFCVRRCGGNQAVGADLAQEVFLKLIENIHRYRFTGKFTNFLFTIAVNTCNNDYKKKKPVHAEIEAVADTVPNVEEIAVLREESRRIVEALNQLSDIQKETVILRFYHNMKVKDIAAITHVPLPTAKSRLKQGLDKLRRKLKLEDFERE